MFPWESRRTRRSGRERRRPELSALEGLEARELLAYSPLGASLPTFAVSGYASPAASWSGPVTVTVNVQNLGASSINEPLNLAPGSTSSADAGASVVDVYAVKSPRSFAGAVQVGVVDVPALSQNNFTQISQTLTLPARPAGFPGDGGKIYLVYRANATGSVYSTTTTPAVSKPVPVSIQSPLPQLQAVGLDLPPTMQPGDTVQPNVRVENLGPADTSPQGNVTVLLVASTTPYVNSGSTVVASYTVANVPGTSTVSSAGPVAGNANQSPQNNVVTIAGSPVTLPASPRTYYLGVVVDPYHQIRQLPAVGPHHRVLSNFMLVRKVGPPVRGLPPAGVLVNGGASLVPTFPTPLGGHPVGGVAGGSYPITVPASTPTTTGLP